jgi:hypothetical protein
VAEEDVGIDYLPGIAVRKSHRAVPQLRGNAGNETHPTAFQPPLAAIVVSCTLLVRNNSTGGPDLQKSLIAPRQRPNFFPMVQTGGRVAFVVHTTQSRYRCRLLKCFTFLKWMRSKLMKRSLDKRWPFWMFDECRSENNPQRSKLTHASPLGGRVNGSRT